MSLCLAVIGVRTSAATHLMAQAPTKQDTLLTTIPRIPAQPHLVTVIPFHAYQGTPWVMVQADVDGHRGLWSLDTGSPVIFLNGSYLRPSATGGIDTVTGGNQQQGMVTVHTVHVGTIVQSIDSIVTGLPPGAPYPTNAVAQSFPDNGILGNLGLTSMEPFETIVDYTHQRVVFIRLDKAGHRLTDVPAYTPVGTVRLLPCATFLSDVPQWWGILVHHATGLDTIIVDTGTPESDIPQAEQYRAADQLKTLLVATHRASPPADSLITVAGEKPHINILGNQFLTRLGVVGFNFRTHQLILYR